LGESESRTQHKPEWFESTIPVPAPASNEERLP
jgi:hypothetical protein